MLSLAKYRNVRWFGNIKSFQQSLHLTIQTLLIWLVSTVNGLSRLCMVHRSESSLLILISTMGALTTFWKLSTILLAMEDQGWSTLVKVPSAVRIVLAESTRPIQLKQRKQSLLVLCLWRTMEAQFSNWKWQPLCHRAVQPPNQADVQMDHAVLGRTVVSSKLEKRLEVNWRVFFIDYLIYYF